MHAKLASFVTHPKERIQALATASKEGRLQVLWSRSFAYLGGFEGAAPEDLQLDLRADGNLVVRSGSLGIEPVWETGTRVPHEWLQLLMDLGDFGDADAGSWAEEEKDMNGWWRYAQMRRNYKSDFFSTTYMVDQVFRSRGTRYCGAGDVMACTEAESGGGVLRPGYFLREGGSLGNKLLTMTVHGNLLQGIFNFAGWAGGGLTGEDITIPVRKGKPYLNAVEGRVSVQEDGNLVLYYRQTSCEAWFDEDEDKFYKSEMSIPGGAYDCRKPGVICKCRGDEGRDLLGELDGVGWAALWSSDTNVYDPSKRNGPYALLLSSGGDLELVDGDARATWRVSTGNAGPIQCAVVAAVKRMPGLEDWDDSHVNLAVYRKHPQATFDPCSKNSAALLVTSGDDSLVWSTLTTPDDDKPRPGPKGHMFSRWRARLDDPFHAFCSTDMLENCKEVPEGAAEMRPGQVLREGKSLEVSLGRMTMQADGNLVIGLGRGKAIWESFTHGGYFHEDKQRVKERNKGYKGPYAFVMTSLAELAIVDGRGEILWFVDSLKLYTTQVQPDSISLMDRIFSPLVTGLGDTLSRGMFADSFNPESDLVEAGCMEFDRWKLVLQGDGNLVLLAKGLIPLFRTNTGNWHAESDEWPKAILSTTNLYGDGWTRFDPRTGDTFMQKAKFWKQLITELVMDLVMSIFTGGTWALAKIAAYQGAKAAVAFAKNAIKASVKAAFLAGKSLVVGAYKLGAASIKGLAKLGLALPTAMVKSAKYLKRVGLRGLLKDTKDIGIRLIAMGKKGVVALKGGLKQLTVKAGKNTAAWKTSIKAAIGRAVKMNARAFGKAVGKYLLSVVFKLLKVTFKVKWLIIKTPFKLARHLTKGTFKWLKSVIMDIPDVIRGIKLLLQYGGDQALAKIGVKIAGKEVTQEALYRSISAAVKRAATNSVKRSAIRTGAKYSLLEAFGELDEYLVETLEHSSAEVLEADNALTSSVERLDAKDGSYHIDDFTARKGYTAAAGWDGDGNDLLDSQDAEDMEHGPGVVDKAMQKVEKDLDKALMNITDPAERAKYVEQKVAEAVSNFDTPEMKQTLPRLAGWDDLRKSMGSEGYLQMLRRMLDEKPSELLKAIAAFDDVPGESVIDVIVGVAKAAPPRDIERITQELRSKLVALALDRVIKNAALRPGGPLEDSIITFLGRSGVLDGVVSTLAEGGPAATKLNAGLQLESKIKTIVDQMLQPEANLEQLSSVYVHLDDSIGVYHGQSNVLQEARKALAMVLDPANPDSLVPAYAIVDAVARDKNEMLARLLDGSDVDGSLYYRLVEVKKAYPSLNTGAIGGMLESPSNMDAASLWQQLKPRQWHRNTAISELDGGARMKSVLLEMLARIDKNKPPVGRAIQEEVLLAMHKATETTRSVMDELLERGATTSKQIKKMIARVTGMDKSSSAMAVGEARARAELLEAMVAPKGLPFSDLLRQAGISTKRARKKWLQAWRKTVKASPQVHLDVMLDASRRGMYRDAMKANSWFWWLTGKGKWAKEQQQALAFVKVLPTDEIHVLMRRVTGGGLGDLEELVGRDAARELQDFYQSGIPNSAVDGATQGSKDVKTTLDDAALYTGVDRYRDIDIMPQAVESEELRYGMLDGMKPAGLIKKSVLPSRDPIGSSAKSKALSGLSTRKWAGASDEVMECRRALRKGVEQDFVGGYFPTFEVRDVYSSGRQGPAASMSKLEVASVLQGLPESVKEKVAGKLVSRRPVLPQSELDSLAFRQKQINLVVDRVTANPEVAASDLVGEYKALIPADHPVLHLSKRADGSSVSESVFSDSVLEEQIDRLKEGIKDGTVKRVDDSAPKNPALMTRKELVTKDGSLTALAYQGLEHYDSMPSSFRFSDELCYLVGKKDEMELLTSLADPVQLMRTKTKRDLGLVGPDSMVAEGLGSYLLRDDDFMGAMRSSDLLASYLKKNQLDEKMTRLDLWTTKAHGGVAPKDATTLANMDRAIDDAVVAHSRSRGVMTKQQAEYVLARPQPPLSAETGKIDSAAKMDIKTLDRLFDPSDPLCLTNGQTDRILGRLAQTRWQMVHDIKNTKSMQSSMQEAAKLLGDAQGKKLKSVVDKLRVEEVRGRGNCYFDSVLRQTPEIKDAASLRRKFGEKLEGMDVSFTSKGGVDLSEGDAASYMLTADREGMNTSVKESNHAMVEALDRPIIYVNNKADWEIEVAPVYHFTNLEVKGKKPVVIYLKPGHAMAFDPDTISDEAVDQLIAAAEDLKKTWIPQKQYEKYEKGKKGEVLVQIGEGSVLLQLQHSRRSMNRYALRHARLHGTSSTKHGPGSPGGVSTRTCPNIAAAFMDRARSTKAAIEALVTSSGSAEGKLSHAEKSALRSKLEELESVDPAISALSCIETAKANASKSGPAVAVDEQGIIREFFGSDSAPSMERLRDVGKTASVLGLAAVLPVGGMELAGLEHKVLDQYVELMGMQGVDILGFSSDSCVYTIILRLSSIASVLRPQVPAYVATYRFGGSGASLNGSLYADVVSASVKAGRSGWEELQLQRVALLTYLATRVGADVGRVTEKISGLKLPVAAVMLAASEARVRAEEDRERALHLVEGMGVATEGAVLDHAEYLGVLFDVAEILEAVRGLRGVGPFHGSDIDYGHGSSAQNDTCSGAPEVAIAGMGIKDASEMFEEALFSADNSEEDTGSDGNLLAQQGGPTPAVAILQGGYSPETESNRDVAVVYQRRRGRQLLKRIGKLPSSITTAAGKIKVPSSVIAMFYESSTGLDSMRDLAMLMDASPGGARLAVAALKLKDIVWLYRRATAVHSVVSLAESKGISTAASLFPGLVAKVPDATLQELKREARAAAAALTCASFAPEGHPLALTMALAGNSGGIDADIDGAIMSFYGIGAGLEELQGLQTDSGAWQQAAALRPWVDDEARAVKGAGAELWRVLTGFADAKLSMADERYAEAVRRFGVDAGVPIGRLVSDTVLAGFDEEQGSMLVEAYRKARENLQLYQAAILKIREGDDWEAAVGAMGLRVAANSTVVEIVAGGGSRLPVFAKAVLECAMLEGISADGDGKPGSSSILEVIERAIAGTTKEGQGLSDHATDAVLLQLSDKGRAAAEVSKVCRASDLGACDVRSSHDYLDRMGPGQGLQSPYAIQRHGGFSDDDERALDLRMQSDGNLILNRKYNNFWGNDDEEVIWASNGGDKGYGLYGGTYVFVLESGGDLVVVDKDSGSERWRIETGRKRPVRSLELQGDGNLVVYRKTGEAIWSTDTDSFYGGNYGDGEWADGMEGLKYKDGDPICDPGARSFCTSAVGSLRMGRSIRSSIFRGERLRQGETLRDAGDPRYALLMQSDGNLVMYGPDGAIWDSDSDGEGASGDYQLIFDVRGDLYVIDKNGEVLWDFANDNLVAAGIHRRDEFEPRLWGYNGENSGELITGNAWQRTWD